MKRPPLRGTCIAGSLVLVLALAACDEGASSTSEAVTAKGTASELLAERLDVIEAHVAEWRGAETIDEAKAAAEAAANHVVGPDGPDFGDRDGDGDVRGPTDAGILPGLDGSNSGFALDAVNNGAPSCVEKDVLGGSWSNPSERWSIMDTAIAEWRPQANTMPSLPSHPQRIVGWATFTLDSDSLEKAHEYAGHAKLHVDVSQAALIC